MALIYKSRGFARFQRRERIADATLRDAVARPQAGLVDADLGGGLIKPRVARAGKGKSGGYRTILALRRGGRAFFLYGFAKNERANIDADELQEFRRVARGLLGLEDAQMAARVEAGEVVEVEDGEAG